MGSLRGNLLFTSGVQYRGRIWATALNDGIASHSPKPVHLPIFTPLSRFSHSTTLPRVSLSVSSHGSDLRGGRTVHRSIKRPTWPTACALGLVLARTLQPVGHALRQHCLFCSSGSGSASTPAAAMVSFNFKHSIYFHTVPQSPGLTRQPSRTISRNCSRSKGRSDPVYSSTWPSFHVNDEYTLQLYFDLVLLAGAL